MNAIVDTPTLVFTDIQSGGDYLSALPLASPMAAEEKLTAFLDALLAAPPDPGILFSLLEQARVPLCFVEEEMARRYYNRPLPLSDDEEMLPAGRGRLAENGAGLCDVRANGGAGGRQRPVLGTDGDHSASLPVLHRHGDPRTLPCTVLTAGRHMAGTPRFLRDGRGMAGRLHASRGYAGEQPAGESLRGSLRDAAAD